MIGGSGFVGTNLCKELANRKISFEIVDRKISRRFPEHCKFADVRELCSLKNTITGDIVVNLAAVHRDDISDKSEYEKTNILGSANVAQVCREKGIKKIVFTSSVAVYGFAPSGTDETGEIKPFSEYGRTKFEAEEKLRKWHNDGRNSLIIVRPTVIFGEGNRGNVYNLFKQIASARFVMVGSGTNKKSMAYVANVTEFLVYCIQSKKNYALYNYVDTPDFDMNSLVHKVLSTLNRSTNIGFRLPYRFALLLGYLADAFTYISGKKLPLSSIRVRKFCSSTSFATSTFNLKDFKAPYKLSEGIERTVRNEFITPDPSREIFYTE